jgi:hypothetical protein
MLLGLQFFNFKNHKNIDSQSIVEKIFDPILYFTGFSHKIKARNQKDFFQEKKDHINLSYRLH